MSQTTPNKEKLIERLFGAGAHFGYSRSRRHPSTTKFIFGVKNNTEILDLEKASDLIEKAKEAIANYGKDKKVVLFVGGKQEAQKPVRAVAGELSMPFVAGRWIGGTLTNFAEIKKRIARLESLRISREKGEFQKKYTKKERLLIDREIAKLELQFSGLLPMKDQLPALLVVVDTKHEEIAINEAKARNIPVLGIGNSDCDLTAVSFPVLANDSSQKTISIILEELKEAYEHGMKNAPVVQ